MAHPNLIFSSFKTAAAMAMRPMEMNGSAGVGDSMKSFRAGSASPPRWTAPNPTQSAPSPSPIAAQKTAPPPPVQ